MSQLGKSILDRLVASPGFSNLKLSVTTMRDRNFVHFSSALLAASFGEAIARDGAVVVDRSLDPDFTEYKLIDGTFIIVDARTYEGRHDGWVAFASNDRA